MPVVPVVVLVGAEMTSPDAPLGIAYAVMGLGVTAVDAVTTSAVRGHSLPGLRVRRRWTVSRVAVAKSVSEVLRGGDLSGFGEVRCEGEVEDESVS